MIDGPQAAPGRPRQAAEGERLSGASAGPTERAEPPRRGPDTGRSKEF